MDVKSVIAVIQLVALAGAAYFLYPWREDWMPLEPDPDRELANYFDRSSISWSGNTVAVALKSVSRSGGPIKSAPWTIEGAKPIGMRTVLSIDCQQRRTRVEGVQIFVHEGQYGALPVPAEMQTFSVLNAKSEADRALLNLCDSQKPGVHPFRYKFVRNFFPSLEQ